MVRRFLLNYAARHQHPANRLLHAIGLPVTFVLPMCLLVHHQPLWAGLAFLAGYLLQFAGHAIEGNDAGEAILVKKLCGRPYVDVIDRINQSSRKD